MSKLKKFTEFFVTIESDEDEVPEEAGSDNPEVAAKAAAEYVSTHPPRQTKQSVSVDPIEDDFDIEALERELAQSRPAPPQKTTGAFSGSSSSSGSAGASGATRSASSGSFVPKSFDDIYSESGLPAELSDAFTVYTIEQLLANPHLQNLPDATKTASLMVALQARNVTVTEVVNDARTRDHALDAHDAELMQSLIDLESAAAEKNAAAEARINALLEELRVEIEQNNAQVEESKAQYYEWKQAKIDEENRLFNTISHLVEPGQINPVSVDEG